MDNFLPPDSPIKQFTEGYDTVKGALDAASAMGFSLPTNVAAELSAAGIGNWGAAGSWAGPGSATGSAVGGSLLGSLATGLGWGTALISGMKLISSQFKGGSADAAKTGRFFEGFQNLSPEQAKEKVDNFIIGGRWSGEWGSNWNYVLQPLFNAGVIDEYYPTLHSADSKYEIYEGVDARTRPQSYERLQYGWDRNKDEAWNELSKGTSFREFYKRTRGPRQGMGRGPSTYEMSYVPKSTPWLGEFITNPIEAAKKGLPEGAADVLRAEAAKDDGVPKHGRVSSDTYMQAADMIDYLNEKVSPQAKYNHAMDVYSKLREEQGYTGDLSKLETFLEKEGARLSEMA